MPGEPLPQVVTATEFPSTDAMRCPYGYYEALREDAPVHRLPSGREYVVPVGWGAQLHFGTGSHMVPSIRLKISPFVTFSLLR